MAFSTSFQKEWVLLIYSFMHEELNFIEEPLVERMMVEVVYLF